MIAASTSTMSQPPTCVMGPFFSARHSRPATWMRTFVSRPGSDAYCGRSLDITQSVGGLFQPGFAVEVCPACGGDSYFGCSMRGVACFTCVPFVGAVVGGAGDCAAAANGSTSAAPRINAPRRRAWLRTMVSSSLLFRVARAQVLVLVVRAIREGLLELLLVPLEAVAGVGLHVLLAGVGLRRVLGNLVAGGEREPGRRDPDQRLHALAPRLSETLSLPP